MPHVLGSIFGSFSVLAVLGILILPYWIPTIVAVRRRVDKKIGIILVNVFLGWTLLGWFGALIWACMAETETQARLREQAYANMAGLQQPTGYPRA